MFAPTAWRLPIAPQILRPGITRHVSQTRSLSYHPAISIETLNRVAYKRKKNSIHAPKQSNHALVNAQSVIDCTPTFSKHHQTQQASLGRALIQHPSSSIALRRPADTIRVKAYGQKMLLQRQFLHSDPAEHKSPLCSAHPLGHWTELSLALHLALHFSPRPAAQHQPLRIHGGQFPRPWHHQPPLSHQERHFTTTPAPSIG